MNTPEEALLDGRIRLGITRYGFNMEGESEFAGDLRPKLAEHVGPNIEKLVAPGMTGMMDGNSFFA